MEHFCLQFKHFLPVSTHIVHELCLKNEMLNSLKCQIKLTYKEISKMRFYEFLMVFYGNGHQVI